MLFEWLWWLFSLKLEDDTLVSRSQCDDNNVMSVINEESENLSSSSELSYSILQDESNFLSFYFLFLNTNFNNCRIV